MNKFFAIFLVILGLVAVQGAPSKDQEEHLKKSVEECQNQEDPPDDEVKSIMKMSPPYTLEGKCFLGCIYEKIGLLVNGAFSSANSEKWIEEVFANETPQQQQAKAEIGACKTELAGIPKDKCQTGPVLQKCLIRMMKNMHKKREQSG